MLFGIAFMHATDTNIRS
ncbi:hypothetical protein CPC197_0716A, partial [Chlamydia psittaci C1/97]